MSVISFILDMDRHFLNNGMQLHGVELGYMAFSEAEKELKDRARKIHISGPTEDMGTTKATIAGHSGPFNLTKVFGPGYRFTFHVDR